MGLWAFSDRWGPWASGTNSLQRTLGLGGVKEQLLLRWETALVFHTARWKCLLTNSEVGGGWGIEAYQWLLWLQLFLMIQSQLHVSSLKSKAIKLWVSLMMSSHRLWDQSLWKLVPCLHHIRVSVFTRNFLSNSGVLMSALALGLVMISPRGSLCILVI